jgi:hypothetical protein
MNNTNDGGPAYPFIFPDESQNRFGQMAEPGMSKREYFAAMAMQGAIAGQTRHDLDKVAEVSVQMADALIAELEQWEDQ